MVVPYIGTWIETLYKSRSKVRYLVVPYIGTWIETRHLLRSTERAIVVPYIGTWIETVKDRQDNAGKESRTLYRYVD